MAIRVKFADQPNVVFEVDTAEEAAALAKLNKSSITPKETATEDVIPVHGAESNNGIAVELDENLRKLIKILAASETGLTGKNISHQMGISAKALGPLFGNLNRWARNRYGLSKSKVVQRERRRIEGTSDYTMFSALHPSLRSRITHDKELTIIERE